MKRQGLGTTSTTQCLAQRNTREFLLNEHLNKPVKKSLLQRLIMKAYALIQSSVDGSHGTGEPHVAGQLAQLINVKNKVWLVGFLEVATGYKAGFHLQLRPHAVVLHRFCP